MATEQKMEEKSRLLKANIAVALHDELRRVPKQEEIDQVFTLTKVMYKAVMGLYFKRNEHEKNRTAGDLLSYDDQSQGITHIRRFHYPLSGLWRRLPT
jgi:hypothetical protein